MTLTKGMDSMSPPAPAPPTEGECFPQSLAAALGCLGLKEVGAAITLLSWLRFQQKLLQ